MTCNMQRWRGVMTSSVLMNRVNAAHVKSCLPRRAVNLPAITAAPLIQEVLSNKSN